MIRLDGIKNSCQSLLNSSLHQLHMDGHQYCVGIELPTAAVHRMPEERSSMHNGSLNLRLTSQVGVPILFPHIYSVLSVGFSLMAAANLHNPLSPILLLHMFNLKVFKVT